MQYKGIELVEMIRKNWDGRSREMLVWDDESPSPYKEIIVGYNPGDNYWMANDGYYWHHCAEIPDVSKEDAMKLLKDNEKEILELKSENKRLKDKIESLKFDRIKMAHDVAWAVDQELMEKSVLYHPSSSFAIYYTKELIEKKILEYMSESKTEKKFRKMTYKELSEWLAKGNGQFKDGNFGSFRTELVYCKNEDNTIVDNNILIRNFNETEWHEPLIEEE